MYAYLIQHAEAKPEEEDPERSLTERGWHEARRVAGFLAGPAGVQVERIVHSGKTRARQTAEVLAEALRPRGGVHAADGLEPMADPQLWAARLQETEGDIALVGHLPHLARLASLLLCATPEREPVRFRYAGVACLERREFGAWSAGWMVIPAILGV